MGNFHDGVSSSAEPVDGTALSHRFKWLVTNNTPEMLSPSAQKINNVINGILASPL